MNTIKATIYGVLSTIAGVKVILSTQSTPAVFPTVAYAVSDNRNTISLEGGHLTQNAEVVVDIFAKSSTSASATLAQVDEKLRSIGWYQTFMQDVPDPDIEVYHISTRYTGTL